MVWKTILISNPGTSIKYGGDDLDKVGQLFNGQVSGLDNVTIGSSSGFYFADSIFAVLNATSKKGRLRLDAGQAADASFYLPAIDTATAQIIIDEVANTLKKKTTLEKEVNLKALSVAPSNPTAGYITLYFDQTLDELRALKSDGTSMGIISDISNVSNVGAGQGVFKQKSGTTAQFYTLGAFDNKLQINAPVSDVVKIQINPANFDLDDFGGTLSPSKLDQITDKTKYHSKVFFLDEAEVCEQLVTFDNRLKIKNTAGGGSTPASGYTILFVDSTTKELSFLTDGGVTKTFITADGSIVFTNKTIDAGFNIGHPANNKILGTGLDNPFSGRKTGPVIKRTGYYLGIGSTNGVGLLSQSLTSVGTTGASLDATEGYFRTFDTGTTTDANAGIHQTSQFFRRDWDCYMIARIKISSTSSVRAFFGFLNDSADFGGSNDWLNAKEGFGIGRRSSETNWQIVKNDNTGATVFVDTGIALNTNFVTIEVMLNSSGGKVSVDGTVSSLETTDLPATTSNLYYQTEIETSSTTAKVLSLGPQWCRVGAD